MLTNKKENYRDDCTYLRREEVNIINKLCSLEMLLYIQRKSQERKLHILMASPRSIILLCLPAHIIVNIRFVIFLTLYRSLPTYTHTLFTLCVLHKLTSLFCQCKDLILSYIQKYYSYFKNHV
jgi:hypothetical protein